MDKSGVESASAPKVSFVSLGCAKNLVDTEGLMGELYHRRFQLVAEPEGSDVVIINTCGFIGSSVAESRNTIAEMLQLKRAGKVGRVYAMGCYVSRGSEDLCQTNPELDGAYSLKQTEELVADLQRSFSLRVALKSQPLAGIRPVSATLPHYSYLKISEGCDRTCTYCTIPSIRGPNADRSIEDLVEETRRLAGRGVVELNLIAQDTTAYGLQRYGTPRLLELLRALSEVKGIEWMRLLYAYPDFITPELAQYLLECPKILNYLELPIQHTHPALLRRMNRPGTFEIYDTLFDDLRAADPEFCLRTTVIVGFPGETEEEFQHMLDYCRCRKFDRLGAFRYHREEGTPAGRMKDQIPPELIEERYDRLMAQQQEQHMNDNRAWVGRDMAFIVDQVSDGGRRGTGRTWRDAVEIDAQIHLQSSVPLRPGMLATCRVSGVRDYDLEGVL